MYIKKTNVVTERKTDGTVKKVQCPYCKVFLEPIPRYVTAMICWKCDKEFRIEHDPEKIVSPEAPSVKGDTTRTIIRG